MVTKIGINGFGRIGRSCLRASLQQEDIEVVAINGTTPPPSLAHLLKYDSVHGTLPNTIETTDHELIIDGRPVKVLSDRNPANLPWKELDVDIVLESTGKFNTREAASVHLAGGAKTVIVTAPCEDADATIVLGVNESTYEPGKHLIISNASCTTNCLAPVAKVLNDSFGIECGFMTTIHAFTSDQRNLDNSHKDLRRARSSSQSIVPTTTGAAKAIGTVIPDLKGKLDGLSVRVPVPNVSLIDLVVQVKKDVSIDTVNNALKKAAEGQLSGIMDYCDKPLVSIDFNNNEHSAIVDALSTNVINNRTVKVLAWYDNEWAYSCRIIELAAYISKKM